MTEIDKLAVLGEFLLKKGYEVHGVKQRASLFNVDRIDQNSLMIEANVIHSTRDTIKGEHEINHWKRWSFRSKVIIERVIIHAIMFLQILIKSDSKSDIKRLFNLPLILTIKQQCPFHLCLRKIIRVFLSFNMRTKRLLLA